jgi:hypothetical protein
VLEVEGKPVKIKADFSFQREDLVWSLPPGQP